MLLNFTSLHLLLQSLLQITIITITKLQITNYITITKIQIRNYRLQSLLQIIKCVINLALCWHEM